MSSEGGGGGAGVPGPGLVAKRVWSLANGRAPSDRRFRLDHPDRLRRGGHEVDQGELVEMLEEALLRAVDDSNQPAVAGQDAALVADEALDQEEVGFDAAHHCADVDPFRRQRQADSAALAAHRFEPAAQAELVRDLRQMCFRDGMHPGDLGNGAQVIGILTNIHQQAHCGLLLVRPASMGVTLDARGRCPAGRKAGRELIRQDVHGEGAGRRLKR